MNEKLTAYALNELPPDERAELEALLKLDPALAAQAAEIRSFCQIIGTHLAPEEETLTSEQRLTLIKTFRAAPVKQIAVRSWRSLMIMSSTAIAACLAFLLITRYHSDFRSQPQEEGVLAQRREPSEQITIMSKALDQPRPQPSAPTPVALQSDVKLGELASAGKLAPDMDQMKQLSRNPTLPTALEPMPQKIPDIQVAAAAPRPTTSSPAKPTAGRKTAEKADLVAANRTGKPAPINMGSAVLDQPLAIAEPFGVDSLMRPTPVPTAQGPIKEISKLQRESGASSAGPGSGLVAPLVSPPTGTMDALVAANGLGAMTGDLGLRHEPGCNRPGCALCNPIGAGEMLRSGEVTSNEVTFTFDYSEAQSIGFLDKQMAAPGRPLDLLSFNGGSATNFSHDEKAASAFGDKVGYLSRDISANPLTASLADFSAPLGTGALMLSGANTYTGGTTISGGILGIGGSSTGSNTLIAATDFKNTNSLSLATEPTPAAPSIPTGSVDLNGSGGVTLTKSGAGSLVLSQPAKGPLGSALEGSSSSQLGNMTGAISGGGGLTKSGDGTLTMNSSQLGLNTSGNLTLGAGTLTAGTESPKAEASAPAPLAKAKVVNGESLDLNSDVNRSAGNTITLSGVMTSSGGIEMKNAGAAGSKGNASTFTTVTVAPSIMDVTSGGVLDADKSMHLADTSAAPTPSGRGTLHAMQPGAARVYQTDGKPAVEPAYRTYTGDTTINGGTMMPLNPTAANTITITNGTVIRGDVNGTALPTDKTRSRVVAASEGKPAQPLLTLSPGVPSSGIAITTGTTIVLKDGQELKTNGPVRAEITQDKTAQPMNGIIGGWATVTPPPPVPASQTYRPIIENPFTYVAQEPLSTFSTDVDTASYANIRHFLNTNQRPPADAVRLEELINYFPYSYEPPANDKPFAVHVDVAEAPWQPLHRLARIGLKAREIHDERRAGNFVFLLDVSGSMSPPERLPLIKQGLRMLVDQLREDDRVSIVTYAGESGVALESTSGDKKEKITQAIERLKSGGSTNGASGIALAYEQAKLNFKKDGINRVILCTDGDFNVGVSNVNQLETIIAEKAKTGVFLSVLGVGTDNLHDHTMQTLADRGNGNYHYLDSLSEARKVLVDQMAGTLVTVAKDVKIQVEFNPAQVAAYRLIGYEKRLLAKQDFNDDKKDAGEIGAGHTITALYEIVPASLKYPDGKPLVDDLKYAPKPAAAQAPSPMPHAPSSELMTVKLRYKAPDGDKSQLMEQPVTDPGKKLSDAPKDFKFAVSVAGFGMLLRDSQQRGDLSWALIRTLAQQGKGEDPNGYRGEFLQLLDKARSVCEPK